MNERRKSSLEFDLRTHVLSSPGIEKRHSTDFTTPPPKRFRDRYGNSTPGSSTPKNNSFPRHLLQISPGLFDSPSTPSSPRLVFKTKDCPECSICSTESFEVRHPHFSSQETELKHTSNNYTRPFFCTVCKKKHTSQSKEGSRLKVMMGSSTLHNLWHSRSYQTDSHVDFDCIIGGRIHDIHASFIYQYDKLPNPMDIVLACGVNNIPTDDTAEDIIMQFKSLVNSIKLHSQNNNHKSPNRVVISSILFAPKYCDPNLRTNNMKDKVRKVNAWIKEFNQQETGEALNLHTYGVQGDPNQDPIVHKYSEWKENDRFRKLHLQPFIKDKIAVELIDLFNRLET